MGSEILDGRASGWQQLGDRGPAEWLVRRARADCLGWREGDAGAGKQRETASKGGVSGQRRLRVRDDDDRDAQPDGLVEDAKREGVADAGRPLVDGVERCRY